MGQPGSQPKQDRNLKPLRNFEGFPGHLIGFLLVPGFHTGSQGKIRIKPGILLILGTVHPRIICHGNHQASLYPEKTAVDEGIRSHVKPHMLHGNQRTAAYERYSQGRFQGGFFIGTPPGYGPPLGIPVQEVFHDLRGGGSRITVRGAYPGMDGPQGNCLIS
jgi:hypothetical protein